MTLDMSEVTRGSAWDRIATDYADFISQHLQHYAQDALQMADVRPGETVLDVATGPGTLSRLTARMTMTSALDHSEEMIATLRRRATKEELSRLELTVGDGQALPYDDNRFDAGFSMFGLFMFPDRARGFAELRRVVKPSGRVVVASWQPSQTQLPAFRIVGEELAKEMDPDADRTMPLSDPEVFASEMKAAGFNVEVKGFTHALEASSTAELWHGLERAHVALGIAKSQLSEERYAAIAARIGERLTRELGDGPQSLPMSAWLALGR